MSGPPTVPGPRAVPRATGGDGLADTLERVLDKGIVIAGDVSIHLVGVELLTIKLRLVVASVDKAVQLGISWWETDPFLSPKAQALEARNKELEARLAQLEAKLGLPAPAPLPHPTTAPVVPRPPEGRR